MTEEQDTSEMELIEGPDSPADAELVPGESYEDNDDADAETTGPSEVTQESIEADPEDTGGPAHDDV